MMGILGVRDVAYAQESPSLYSFLGVGGTGLPCVPSLVILFSNEFNGGAK